MYWFSLGWCSCSRRCLCSVFCVGVLCVYVSVFVFVCVLVFRVGV